MSTIRDTDQPDPRDDPAAVIEEELGDHRDALERLAELDMGRLSQDAERALNILDELNEKEGI